MKTQRETFEIEDVRVLEVLNNPLRLRIVYQLLEPATVREVAERLEVPVTRLYYHIDLLEEVGVIEVVETRKAGAMLKRVYRAVATNFAPVAGLIESTTDKDRVIKAAIGAVLDGARLDAIAGLERHFAAAGQREAEPAGTLGRSVVPMSEGNARRFAERLGALVEEMSEYDDRDGMEYAFSFVFFPMVGPVKGEKL